MKKLILGIFLIGSVAFAVEFQCYKLYTLEQCTEKLNELSENYLIKEYKILPIEINGTITYNMVIKVQRFK